jgi:hypothetical protein
MPCVKLPVTPQKCDTVEDILKGCASEGSPDG